MASKKHRNEIPSEVAAEVLFLADRTCCVCRIRQRPIQLHHIDGDPAKSTGDNLAVLCFDCHRETQIRGGFDRKLDAAQVRKYKADWLRRVEARRAGDGSPTVSGVSGSDRVLQYMQSRERSEDLMYDFEADYVSFGTSGALADTEPNSTINAFVTTALGNFRADAIASVPMKHEMKKEGAGATAWDSLSISHRVWTYTPHMLSLEFQLARYGAGAAHPNRYTRTLNFRLLPPQELRLQDLFRPNTNYLEVLSRYCVEDLHRQQPERWHDPKERREQLLLAKDDWIMRGAGPASSNYQTFSLTKGSIVFHFDPYHVGSYAEGKYEVYLPTREIEFLLQDEVRTLIDSL